MTADHYLQIMNKRHGFALNNIFTNGAPYFVEICAGFLTVLLYLVFLFLLLTNSCNSNSSQRFQDLINVLLLYLMQEYTFHSQWDIMYQNLYTNTVLQCSLLKILRNKVSITVLNITEQFHCFGIIEILDWLSKT